VQPCPGVSLDAALEGTAGGGAEGSVSVSLPGHRAVGSISKKIFLQFL